MPRKYTVSAKVIEQRRNAAIARTSPEYHVAELERQRNLTPDLTARLSALVASATASAEGASDA